eukprot:scaffold13750_cov96-Skeletonema_dohrnii-CCMP3373.AAC.2
MITVLNVWTTICSISTTLFTPQICTKRSYAIVSTNACNPTQVKTRPPARNISPQKEDNAGRSLVGPIACGWTYQCALVPYVMLQFGFEIILCWVHSGMYAFLLIACWVHGIMDSYADMIASLLWLYCALQEVHEVFEFGFNSGKDGHSTHREHNGKVIYEYLIELSDRRHRSCGRFRTFEVPSHIPDIDIDILSESKIDLPFSVKGGRCDAILNHSAVTI